VLPTFFTNAIAAMASEDAYASSNASVAATIVAARAMRLPPHRSSLEP
jgi:hypothetical protein